VSRSPSLSRWSIASRILAALIGGYALAYGFAAFFSVYLPLARPDRVAFAGMLSFAVWTAAAIYAFAVRSATRAWLWLAGLAIVLCLAAFLPGELRVRP
jgi:hypothetical protein